LELNCQNPSYWDEKEDARNKIVDAWLEVKKVGLLYGVQ
jgi:hypothetical protein